MTVSDWRAEAPSLTRADLTWPKREDVAGPGKDISWYRISTFSMEQVHLIYPGGSRFDPEGLFGLHDTLGQLLLSGTKTLQMARLNEKLERWGSRISVTVLQDVLVFSVYLLPEYRHKIVPLVREILTDTTFPGKEVKRVKDRQEALLTAALNDPRKMSYYLVTALTFANTPYEKPTRGTFSGLQAVSREEVRRAYRNVCSSASPRVVGVGEGWEEWLSLFGPGDGKSEIPENEPRFTTFREGKRYFYPREGAAQSEIRMILPIPDSAPLYPLLIMNNSFGGRFTSRLNLNLRETHGYTYGVRTIVVRKQSARYLYLTVAVHNDVTARTLEEIQKERERLVSGGVSARECSESATYLVGNLFRALEAPELLANRALDRIIAGEPEDYFTTFSDRIRSVTAPQVKHAAEQVLGVSDRAVTVVVGAPEVGKELQGVEILDAHPFG